MNPAVRILSKQTRHLYHLFGCPRHVPPRSSACLPRLPNSSVSAKKKARGSGLPPLSFPGICQCAHWGRQLNFFRAIQNRVNQFTAQDQFYIQLPKPSTRRLKLSAARISAVPARAYVSSMSRSHICGMALPNRAASTNRPSSESTPGFQCLRMTFGQTLEQPSAWLTYSSPFGGNGSLL